MTNLGAWLENHPATWEVELATPSSWSCAHGVERWRSDCGCTTGSLPGWNQSWRAPLREALDWLRASLAEPIVAGLRPLLGDPLAAMLDYGVVLAGGEAPEVFVARRAGRHCSDAETTHALELLELKNHLLSAFTSCAWFFADPTGIETLLSLQQAALVLDTADRVLGLDVATGFLERLERVRSNTDPTLTGQRSLGPLHRAASGRREVRRRGFRLGAGGQISSFLDATWSLDGDRSGRRDGCRSGDRYRRRRTHPDAPAHRGRDRRRVHRGCWCRGP